MNCVYLVLVLLVVINGQVESMRNKESLRSLVHDKIVKSNQEFAKRSTPNVKAYTKMLSSSLLSKAHPEMFYMNSPMNTMGGGGMGKMGKGKGRRMPFLPQGNKQQSMHNMPSHSYPTNMLQNQQYQQQQPNALNMLSGRTPGLNYKLNFGNTNSMMNGINAMNNQASVHGNTMMNPGMVMQNPMQQNTDYTSNMMQPSSSLSNMHHLSQKTQAELFKNHRAKNPNHFLSQFRMDHEGESEENGENEDENENEEHITVNTKRKFKLAQNVDDYLDEEKLAAQLNKKLSSGKKKSRNSTTTTTAKPSEVFHDIFKNINLELPVKNEAQNGTKNLENLIHKNTNKILMTEFVKDEDDIEHNLTVDRLLNDHDIDIKELLKNDKLLSKMIKSYENL